MAEYTTKRLPSATEAETRLSKFHNSVASLVDAHTIIGEQLGWHVGHAQSDDCYLLYPETFEGSCYAELDIEEWDFTPQLPDGQPGSSANYNAPKDYEIISIQPYFRVLENSYISFARFWVEFKTQEGEHINGDDGEYATIPILFGAGMGNATKMCTEIFQWNDIVDDTTTPRNITTDDLSNMRVKLRLEAMTSSAIKQGVKVPEIGVQVKYKDKESSTCVRSGKMRINKGKTVIGAIK